MINTTNVIDPNPAPTSDSGAPTMRLQLALNVKNLSEAVAFYSKMFNVEPVKTRPGYANFVIPNPPLKLVLFEGDEEGTINHLGVEASASSEVIEAEQRLIQSGLETTGIDDTICCYAEKTETWLEGPDSTRWEWYVVTGQSDQAEHRSLTDDAATCGTPDNGLADSSLADSGTACG